MSRSLDRQTGPLMPPFTQTWQRRLAKLLIASVFFVVGELIDRIRAALGRERRVITVALTYHDVPSEQRGSFARQMDHLLRWAVPIPAHGGEALPCGPRCVMITADDGWRSFIENALPELERRRIPVTIFVVSDCLGQSLGCSHDRLITEAELKRLRPELVSVGSHSLTHACLTEMDEGIVWSELRDSRTTLESLLQRAVRMFAFPFGAWTPSLIGKCLEAGYQRVFLAVPSPPLNLPRQFVVGRIRVDPTDWMLEFHLKLMGAYNWLPRAKMLVEGLLFTARA